MSCRGPLKLPPNLLYAQEHADGQEEQVDETVELPLRQGAVQETAEEEGYKDTGQGREVKPQHRAGPQARCSLHVRVHTILSETRDDQVEKYSTKIKK